MTSAKYDSLNEKAQKRFTKGLTFLATYTGSKNEDSTWGAGSNFLNASQRSPQDIYDLAAECSRSVIDILHRFTAATTYDLPFGKGANGHDRKPRIEPFCWTLEPPYGHDLPARIAARHPPENQQQQSPGDVRAASKSLRHESLLLRGAGRASGELSESGGFEHGSCVHIWECSARHNPPRAGLFELGHIALPSGSRFASGYRCSSGQRR